MFARFRKAVAKEDSSAGAAAASAHATNHPPVAAPVTPSASVPPQTHHSAPPPSSPSPSSSVLHVVSSGSQSRYLHTLREYSLLIEFKRLRHDSPSGLYILPSIDSLRRWHGVIFIRKGFYRGGIFKFLLHIPTSYPDDAPRVQFVSDVFHPLINPHSGDLDSSIAFPIWVPQQHFVKSLLKFIKEIFYITTYWDPRPNVEPFNKAAAKLWVDNPEEFHRKVSRCCGLSIDKVFVVEEGSSLKFMRPIPQHEAVWKKIVTSHEDEEKREKERMEKLAAMNAKGVADSKEADGKEEKQEDDVPKHSKVNFISWFSNGIDRLSEGPPVPGMVSPYQERSSALAPHNLPLVAPPVLANPPPSGPPQRSSVTQTPTKKNEVDKFTTPTK